jgi:hypothetical protein
MLFMEVVGGVDHHDPISPSLRNRGMYRIRNRYHGILALPLAHANVLGG